MARIMTCGFEAKVGQLSTTYETSIVRSGQFSGKCDSGAANSIRSLADSAFSAPGMKQRLTVANANATFNFFGRAYYNFATYPTAVAAIMRGGAWSADGTPFGAPGIQMNTDGTIRGFGHNGAVSAWSSTAIPLNTWVCIEISGTVIVVASTSRRAIVNDIRIDGISQGLSADGTLTNPNPAGNIAILTGWLEAPGANSVMYVDDMAMNDDSGANQNSWPGPGKIALLLPASDNSAGSWRAGSAANAAANGALFEAINNNPPVGTASPLATTAGISNAVSGATTPNGDFNMETYASKGIDASATVTLVQMMISHGEDVATGTKTGTFTVVSNPAQGATDAVGDVTGNQFGPNASGATGTYSTNWIDEVGSPIYSPSITPGTAPVCRITKTDTGTRAADLCFMGLMVEYVPAAFTPYVNPYTQVLPQ